ncbi:hypothetical protein RCG23_21425 [Neobacillus sp. PS3-34]|uniref:hypothetical protein n=1 Tax=Neobacillus sp. PS3-34 TaxID=3070678 RepID=UPI0027DFFC69|nr:hypothetical protein [Neobacillus sp. PS3-34]WML47855.1 hypothetical protein RCG23_21425 [Neobacillus sp. PS3-34]
MTEYRTAIEAIIEDVNNEDGYFLTFAEKTINLIFFIIKWGCIPFFVLILLTFLKMH